MLSSLKVKNFRGIRDLEVESLNQVNLFVGKNNTGKSSVLEAIHLYGKRGNPEILNELIAHRDENWQEEVSAEGDYLEEYLEPPLRYLFFGYHISESNDEGFSIGPKGPEQENIKVNRVFVKREETDEGVRRTILNQRDFGWELEEDNIEPAIQIEYMGESRVFPLYRLEKIARRSYSKPLYGEERVQLVPTENLSDIQLNPLWNSIELTGLQKQVISGLRLIDERVADVAMLGNSRRRRGPIPMVKLEDEDLGEEGERVPLKTMGDGMTRVFHILLALVNAKDGYLLVDEFENGIHWSALPKLWEMVFDVAGKLNVQVIATTHSKDCVKSFYDIWKEKPDVATFHRIGFNPKREIKSLPFSHEDLEDALESGIEVR